MTQVAASAVTPDKWSHRGQWSDRLVFAPSADGKALRLKVDDHAVRQVLAQLCRGFVTRRYDHGDMLFEEGSLTV